MVDVAQLVEPRIVIPAVVGSSPIVHPNFSFVTLSLSWQRKVDEIREDAQRPQTLKPFLQKGR